MLTCNRPSSSAQGGSTMNFGWKTRSSVSEVLSESSESVTETCGTC